MNKNLYAIEVKPDKKSNHTMIITEAGGYLAIYENKTTAKNKFNEIYQRHKQELLKLGVKPYPKNRFVIKKYEQVAE